MGSWPNGKAPGCKPEISQERWFDSITSHQVLIGDHMRKVALRNSGFSVFVFKEGENPPPGEVNMREKEFDWAVKLSRDFSDTEAQREFWRVLREKKIASPAYSLFDDFPIHDKTDSVAEKYCREITEKLKGTAAKAKERA